MSCDQLLSESGRIVLTYMHHDDQARVANAFINRMTKEYPFQVRRCDSAAEEGRFPNRGSIFSQSCGFLGGRGADNRLEFRSRRTRGKRPTDATMCRAGQDHFHA